MACATLKRSLDCVEPAQVAPTRPNKRRCSSQLASFSSHHNHHHHHSHHQRLYHHNHHHSHNNNNLYNDNKFTTMSSSSSALASGLASCSSSASATIINLPPKEMSPFAEIHPRLTEEVATSIRDEIKRLQHRRPLLHANNTSKVSQEPLVFSVRQTQLICERLIKERETRLREEYDKILASKLAEQYDTYVKFTFDQIQKQYDGGSIPSYLS